MSDTEQPFEAAEGQQTAEACAALASGATGQVPQEAEQLAPEAEPVSNEPTLDTSALRLECGHIGTVLEHMKAWVEWRLGIAANDTNPPPPAAG